MQKQVKESHEILLQQASNSGSKKEKNAIIKVQKLLAHMKEAIEWLNQQKNGDEI